ncbi:hypothetical protein [Aureimonas sp. AU40]|uniref:hypothetical protein n=1 Tax=Aureimonas sp. AU40 TaxID=1637747 RepID=UPI00078487ED|nr:hypothetical protein [Aureimonas sp. AU40]
MSARANLSHRENYDVTVEGLNALLVTAEDLLSGLTVADSLQMIRQMRKRFEELEKAPAEFVKLSDKPTKGVGCVATRNLIPGGTQWKQVAEKVAADAGVALDDAFLAPFKNKAAYRVDLTEATAEQGAL